MASEDYDKIIADIVAALEANNSHKALRLVDDDAFSSKLELCWWPLVVNVCELITEENCEKEALLDGCSHILLRMCDVSNAKELLLVLLEQVDRFKVDVRFLVLLPPMQKCLLKLPARRGHSTGWTLITLYSHISTLPKPEEQLLSGHERKLLDVDECVCRAAKIVTAFLDFLEPLVDEANWQIGSDSVVKTSNALSDCLLKVLEFPLAQLDLVVSSTTDGLEYKPRGRPLAEKILQQLAKLHANFAKHLIILRQRIEDEAEKNQNKSQENQADGDKNDKCDDDDIDDNDDDYKRTPELGVSVMAYLIFSEQLENDNLPQVMAHQYWLELNLPFMTCLLTKPQWLVQEKGVALFGSIVGRIPPASLPADFCSTHRVKLLLQALLHVLCTGQSKETSQSALKHFTTFLWCFEPAGRYNFIRFILNKSKHPGVLGYCTTQLKELIDRNLSLETPDAVFCGASLLQLLRLVFVLPDADTTDLMEHSARIMAALNLLRYLVLRDKPAADVTGVWSLLPDIESSYSANLRMAINMSRAHFQADLEKAKKGEPTTGAELELTVGSEAVPGVPREQKIQLFNVALHTFDMMESVLGRIGELVEQAKKADRQ